MNNNRRKFLRTASLTATGAMLISPIEAKKIKIIKATAIGCAPERRFELAGTVTSVQSGNWSDPATWGGKVPASEDTPLIASGHTVVYDVSLATVAGVNISNGGVLAFDSGNSATLQSTANIVVEGKLQMRPSAVSVIQTLRFTSVNESKFAGGGMSVMDTDVGLWVMVNGQLDLAGTAKTSWTRATGSIAAGAGSISVESADGWQAGDEIVIAPTEPPSVGAAFASGFDERAVKSISGNTVTLGSTTGRAHPMVNNQWTAEVMNLTRNVRIEGTTSGRAHIFIRSASVQSIQYVAIRYMGPRKDRNGDGVAELVAGRYGMHFHHSMDGTRGSRIEGNVIRDTGNHSYVPHVSHGIKFIDNIAYNVLETAFWWDPGDSTHDVIWDHNIVANCRYVARSLNMNAEDAPSFSSSGFALNTGDGNICRNNVVIGGGMGDVADGGAYNWEAVINEGVWIFHDNLSHNNDCGLRVWQNSTRNHVVENYTAYHNRLAVFHGAYANSYTYNGGTLYGNGIQVKAASVNSNRVRIENITIDGAGMVDYGIEVIHSPLPGDRPVFVRNVTIRNCKVGALRDSAEPEVHSTDMVQCTIDGNLVVAAGAASGETIRVQPVSGQPYQVTQAGKNNIAVFAPAIWGNGKGLKAEYFNGSNFNNPAFTRIDSNVSFSEWSAGVHYAITGNAYSVRWTGKIQPQYSESYTFSLGSGGGHRLWIDNKLILDSWTEHYPDLFQSSPITLVAGQLYDIRLEYFNAEGGTGMGLFWKSASLPLEYVPQSQLFTDAVIVTPPANQAPVANAGTDITITLPVSSATLNGTASADPDGTITAYKWTKISGPAQFTIANATAATTAVNNLAAGTYVFRLQVTDNKGAVNEDDVTVTVLAAPPANQAPVANAGSDITITLPTNSAALDGSASVDPDGSISKYAWTKVSGPAQYSIANPAAASTQVTNLVEGVYAFGLVITDDKGVTAQDEVMVTVKKSVPMNQAPVANAGSDVTIVLPANSITLDGSASSDPDGTAITYAWSKLSGPSQFAIASSASATTQVSNLVEGVYVFRLTVKDNAGATATDEVTVTVQAAAQANKVPVANAGSDMTITLPVNSVTLDGSASSDPDGRIVSYTWTKVSGPVVYVMASPNAVSTTVYKLEQGTYVFRLEVTDDKGATNVDEVTVIVNGSKTPDEILPLTVVVYPNPFRYAFSMKITSGYAYPISVTIYNDQGNIVDRRVNLGNDVTIRLGFWLRRGVYTAVVEQQGVNRILRLLKL